MNYSQKTTGNYDYERYVKPLKSKKKKSASASYSYKTTASAPQQSIPQRSVEDIMKEYEAWNAANPLEPAQEVAPEPAPEVQAEEAPVVPAEPVKKKAKKQEEPKEEIPVLEKRTFDPVEARRRQAGLNRSHAAYMNSFRREQEEEDARIKNDWEQRAATDDRALLSSVNPQDALAQLVEQRRAANPDIAEARALADKEKFTKEDRQRAEALLSNYENTPQTDQAIRDLYERTVNDTKMGAAGAGIIDQLGRRYYVADKMAAKASGGRTLAERTAAADPTYNVNQIMANNAENSGDAATAEAYRQAMANMAEQADFGNMIDDASRDHRYAYGAGKMAAILAENAALGNLLGEAGYVADTGNKVVDFLANQGIKSIPDVLADTIPTLAEAYDEGERGLDLAKTGLVNYGTNVAFNVGTDMIPALYKRLRGSADPEFLENLRKYDNDILRPIAEEAEGVARQADALNVDNVARQSVENSFDVPAGKYNPDYKGVDVSYNDKFVEPEKLVYSLTGEQVSPEFAAAVRKLESGQPITPEEYASIPEIIEARKRAGSAGDFTDKAHIPSTDANGNLTERGKLRQKWLDDLWNNYTGSATRQIVDGKEKTVYNGIVNRGKRADIILGLPSSGKSSAIVDPISAKYKSRLIDSDEAKKLIPEFDEGWGAGRVHEESSEITAELLARSIANGENMVIPKVGGKYDSIKEIIDALKSEGYTVHVHFNDLDPNKAAGRNMRRLAKDGRFLDLDVTSFAYTGKKDPRKVFDRIVKEGGIDGYTKVSNDVGFGEHPVQLDGTEDLLFDWGNDRPRGGEISLNSKGGISPDTSGAAGAAEPANPEAVGEAQPENIPVLLNDADRAAQEAAERASREAMDQMDMSGDMGGIDNEISRSGGTYNQNNVRPDGSGDTGITPAGGQEIGGGDEAGRSLGLRDRSLDESVFVSPEERARFAEAGISDQGLKNYSNDYQTFSDALSEARTKVKDGYGAFVDPKSPEELAEANAIALMSDDRACTVAVKSNGDIVGVCKNPDIGKHGGAVTDMLFTARKAGGDRLDCYGAGLVSKYTQCGFEPVARVKYEYGINPEMDEFCKTHKAKDPNFVEPDVFFMKVRDGESIDDSLAALKNETFKEYSEADLAALPEMDYDSAMKYRDDLIDNGKIKEPVSGGEPTNGNVPPVDNGGPVPPKGPNETNERSYARNVRTKHVEGVPDELAAEFVDQPEIYNVLHNADTANKAQQSMDKGLTAARNDFDSMLASRDPAAIPLGHSIAKAMSAEGDYDGAAEIVRRMSEELTKSGQFSQAAAITMLKNDPLTAMAYAEKQLNKLNAEGAQRFGKKWKDFSLTKEEKELFGKIKPGDSDAIKEAYDAIGKRIGMEYPTTFMDKLLEARKIAMLFNLRTNVRNAGANVPTLGMRWTADRVEAIGQNIAHLIDPDFKVTQAVRGNNKESRRIAAEVFNSDKVKALIDRTSGKYEIPSLKNDVVKNTTMYKGGFISHWIDDMTNGGIQKLNKKVFGKEGVRSGAETLRNATYKLLDLGDSPFVRMNFEQRLGSYIRAQGIKSAAEVPDEAIQLAWEEAMKATYKDDSWAVQMLKGIRNNGIGKIPGIGKPLSQAAIPFLQAPGNIAARMVDYSPIRGTKGVADIIKGAKGADQNLVRRGIEEASKGLTGTGMVLLGMKLHDSGLLTGASADDKDERAFDKQTGWRPFALHVGNKYYTYDWAQPAAEPMIVGALLSEAIKNSDEYDSDLMKYLGHEGTTAGKVIGGVKAGASAAVNSWFDASPLQGLQELMGGSNYKSGSNIAANIAKVGGNSFLESFIPSVVNATAKTIDPVTRQTTDPSNGVASEVNMIISKIPMLSKNLPAKYDTWGREMKTGENAASAFVARFINPGDYSYDKETPNDSEIKRLFKETNNIQVFPQVAGNKVGEKTLNSKEISDYQRDMGQRSYKMVEGFMNSDLYKSLDDESRVEVLNSIYGISKALTERDLFGKDVAKNSQKMADAYDKGGVDGLVDFLSTKYNPYGIDQKAYSAMTKKGEDMSKYEGYGEALGSRDLDDKEAYRKAWSEGGEKGLNAYLEKENNEYGLKPEAYQKMLDEGEDLSKYKGYGEALEKNGVEDKEAYRHAWIQGKEQAVAREAEYQGALNEADVDDSKVNKTIWQDAEKKGEDPVEALSKFKQVKDGAKDEKGNVTKDSILRYANGHNVSQETVDLLASTTGLTGTFKRSGGTWDYYNKDGEKQEEKVLYQPLVKLGMSGDSASQESWDRAKKAIPSLTTDKYASTVKLMDTNKKSGVSQDEVIDYLNKYKVSSADGQKMWSAFVKSDASYYPVYQNGTWKKKRKKKK